MFKALNHLSWHSTNICSTMPLRKFLRDKNTKIHTISLYNCFFFFTCLNINKCLTTLISATSDNPPTENRKNLRFKARAIERPMLVLPTPGGPERQIIFPVSDRKKKKTTKDNALLLIGINMQRDNTKFDGLH